MASSYDVPDPSDWLGTSISQLAPVETALRCQVCKDFFDTPMITSCSHTFCSLCIRRCLTSDGKCPACRAPDQELRLRRNWTVQEIVDAFKIARPAVLQMGQHAKVTSGTSGQNNPKRKLSDTDIEMHEVEDGERLARSTRSQRRKVSNSQQPESSHTNDDERDGDYQPDNGLTACPICNKRMKMEEVFTHLDTHNEPDDISTSISGIARHSPSDEPLSRSRHHMKSMERLPQLNYSLMNDNGLRKKLGGLGIPNGGPRILMEKRHMEWVNLVNANCDSNKPRSKRELLKDLEVWDRSQGRQISNGISGSSDSNTVMRKDFDGVAWASNHNNDFQRLISQARPKGVDKDEPNTKTPPISNHVPNPEYSHPDQPSSFSTQYTGISDIYLGRSEQPLSGESLKPNPGLIDKGRFSDIGVKRSADTVTDLECSE